MLCPEALCVLITQHKLHESMQNFILKIIYHTREMIFYFVRETNLLKETSENCIRRRYIITSQFSILSPFKTLHSLKVQCRLKKEKQEKLLMKINLFYQVFSLSDFSLPSSPHWTVQGTLNCFSSFFFHKCLFSEEIFSC